MSKDHWRIAASVVAFRVHRTLQSVTKCVDPCTGLHGTGDLLRTWHCKCSMVLEKEGKMLSLVIANFGLYRKLQLYRNESLTLVFIFTWHPIYTRSFRAIHRFVRSRIRITHVWLWASNVSLFYSRSACRRTWRPRSQDPLHARILTVGNKINEIISRMSCG